MRYNLFVRSGTDVVPYAGQIASLLAATRSGDPSAGVSLVFLVCDHALQPTALVHAWQRAGSKRPRGKQKVLQAQLGRNSV